MNRMTASLPLRCVVAILLCATLATPACAGTLQVESPLAPVIWPAGGGQPLEVDLVFAIEQPVAGLTAVVEKLTRPDGTVVALSGVSASAAAPQPGAAPSSSGLVVLRLTFPQGAFAPPGLYVAQCRVAGESVGADAKRSPVAQLVTISIVRHAATVQFLGGAAPTLRATRTWPWSEASAGTTLFVRETSGQAPVRDPSVSATPPTLAADQTIGGTLAVILVDRPSSIPSRGSTPIDVDFGSLGATGVFTSTITLDSPSLVAPVSQVVTVRVTTWFVWALVAVALGVFASAVLNWWSSTGRLRTQRSWRVASLRLRVVEAQAETQPPMRPAFAKLLADLDDLYARIGMDLVGEFDTEFAKLKGRFDELTRPPTESAMAARAPNPVEIENTFKGFELATFLLPLFAAVIAGTLQLALDKPVWGTPSDFATAFLWGFGADLTLRGITAAAGTLVRPRAG